MTPMCCDRGGGRGGGHKIWTILVEEEWRIYCSAAQKVNAFPLAILCRTEVKQMACL